VEISVHNQNGCDVWCAAHFVMLHDIAVSFELFSGHTSIKWRLKLLPGRVDFGNGGRHFNCLHCLCALWLLDFAFEATDFYILCVAISN